MKPAWVTVFITFAHRSAVGFPEPKKSYAADWHKGCILPSASSEKEGQPTRSTKIDRPGRSWATSVDQAKTPGRTPREQAKTPETERFQAFFLLF
jgi:nitrite reductase (NADH) large subunit